MVMSVLCFGSSSYGFDLFEMGAQVVDFGGRQINRAGALHAAEECIPLGSGSDVGRVDDRFCEEIKAGTLLEALVEVDTLMEGAVKDKVEECRVLNEVRANIYNNIVAIRDKIDIAEGDINNLVLEIGSPPPFQDTADASANDQKKLFFKEKLKAVENIEYRAQLMIKNINYLLTGNGEPPNADGEPFISRVEAKMADACGKAVLQANTVSGPVATGSRSIQGEINIPTLARVSVSLRQNIEEEHASIENERDKVEKGIDEARSEAKFITTLIEGRPTVVRAGDNGSGDGLMPAINGARQIIYSAQELAGISVGGDDHSGGCVGITCNTSGGGSGGQPAGGAGTGAGRGGGVTDGTVAQVSDGQGYGGGSPADNNTNSNNNELSGENSNGSTAMGKTGSGFQMPDMGSMFSGGNNGASNNNPSPSFNAGNIANNVNYGGAGFNRYNNNASSSGFNAPATRTPASVNPSQQASRRGVGAMYDSGGGSMGGGQYGGGGNFAMGQSGGSADAGAASGNNRSARAKSSANKQVFSSKNESTSGSSGRILGSKGKSVNVDARVAQLKADRRLAGQDFDPDKYVPRTSAERRALARASGKMAGYAAGSAEWPKDIVRQKGSNIFNLMNSGYKKQFLID